MITTKFQVSQTRSSFPLLKELRLLCVHTIFFRDHRVMSNEHAIIRKKKCYRINSESRIEYRGQQDGIGCIGCPDLTTCCCNRAGFFVARCEDIR